MVKEHLHQVPRDIIAILKKVKDPEIPVLSILDLGVVYRVKMNGTQVHLDIMPTYTGCPAMEVITEDIKEIFENTAYSVHVNLILSPPWTTDMISPEGREALKSYGIAPPVESSSDKAALLHGANIIPCPQCGSTNTKMISQFGSTACKALFKCNDCLEPFDYFKCLK